MAFEHPTVRLGDFVDACLGKMLDTHKNRGVLQPYLGNSNVRWGAFDLEDLAEMRFEEHEDERYSIRYGDLIVCEGGEPGRCAIWRGDMPGMKIQKALHRVRVKEGLDNYFLYYWFLQAGKTGALEPFFTGSTIKHLTGKALSELQIPLPPIGAQRRLATVLKSLDDKIDLNRRINQTLEAMAQALFKSWFVDFDPVKAKIAARQEGRDPLRAAMSAISGKPEVELDALPPEQYAQLAATAALFPDDMEQSELGEIPKGWVVSDMRSLAELISKGTTPSKPDLATAKDEPIVSFIKVKDISETGEIARGNLELIARSIHESSLKRSILKTDDLLLSIAGTVGRTAFVDKDLNGSNVNQAIAFIRLKDKLDHFALCWLTLRSIETQKFIASKVVQAVQANASLANVGDIPVRLPGNDVLKKWNGVISPLILEYRARLSEIRTVATLRDTLLPKLLSGESSVENISPKSEATT